MSIFQLEREGNVEELLRILRESDSPEVRARSAETLGEFDDAGDPGETPVVDGLVEAARTDDAEAVRAAAIDAIDELGLGPIQRLLVEMAGIGGTEDEVGTQAFVGALDAEMPELRMAAANAVGHAGGPNVVPPLLERLDDDHPRVRARAARACGRIGDPRAVEPLCEAVEDPHPRVRREAAEALGEVGDDRAIDPLLDRLEDGSESVRRSAVLALGNFDDPELVERLVDLLEGEVDMVRQAAVYSIIDLLANVSADQSHEMREAVVEALSETADHAVIGPLVEILEESVQAHHRRNAAWLLGRVAGEDPRSHVIDALAEALADSDPMVPQFATTSLAEIGGESVESALLSLLDRDDIDAEARANAVFALGKVGGERARERIDGLIDDTTSEEVREQAFSALSKLGGQLDEREEGEALDDP